MTCLCTRLREARYEDLTSDEIDLLRNVHRHASWLFRDPVSNIEKLRNSYHPSIRSNMNWWWSQPKDFLDYGKVRTAADNTVRLVTILGRLNGSTHRIQKRTVRLALADLHKKNADLDDLVARIRNTPGTGGLGNDKDVKTKVTQDIYIGRKWRSIIQTCAKIWPESSTEESKISGVLWLLDSGSTWEKTNEPEWEAAIRTMGIDFYKQCQQLAPQVNATLNHLKGGVTYQYWQPPGSLESGTGNVSKRRKLNTQVVVNKKTTVNAEETPNNHAYSYSGTPGRYVVANQDFASGGVDGRVGLGEIHQEPFIGYMQNILEPQKQEDVGWQQKNTHTREVQSFSMRILDHPETENGASIPIPAQNPSAGLDGRSSSIRHSSPGAAGISECEDPLCHQQESDRPSQSTTLHHRSAFTVTAVDGLGSMSDSNGVMDGGSTVDILRSVQQSRPDKHHPRCSSPDEPIYNASETGVIDQDTPSLYVGNLRIDDDVMGDLAVFYN